MHINLEIFNKDHTLIGFSYEKVSQVFEFDSKGEPIVEQFHVFTIGLIFVNISFSIPIR